MSPKSHPLAATAKTTTGSKYAYCLAALPPRNPTSEASQAGAGDSLSSFETNPYRSQAEEQPQDAQDSRHPTSQASQPGADDSLSSFETNPYQSEAEEQLQDAQDPWDPGFRPSEFAAADNSQLVSEPDLFQFQAGDPEDSFRTTSTLPLPGGSQRRFAWPYGREPTGLPFAATGRLARDDPRFSMDDAATQQASIPPADPRVRKNDFANLSEKDRTDVLCILSPSSPAAYRAVELVALSAPQHILQNRCLGQNESFLGQDPIEPDSITADKDGSPWKDKRSLDIALRLSSKLVNPCLGFTFGRAPDKCDLLLCTKQRKISGAHFRIYVNAKGTLMCRDTSTNGTLVDSRWLSAEPRAGGFGPQVSLHENSIIEVMLGEKTESVRFFVKIPDRHGESAAYGRKLEAYIQYVEQLGRQDREEFMLQTKGIPIETPPAPMPPFDDFLHGGKLSLHANKNLVAGTEPFNHGMDWNGGDVYKVTAKIGKGAFADVYKLARRHDGELFAAKAIPRSSFVKQGVMDRKVDQELKIMRRLKHPNIVPYIGHHETDDHLYIIMEFIKNGDLQSIITGGQPRFQEYFCQAVASQMCEALKYLHDNNITHRDLKPDNILISSLEPPIFKLSDFGLSKDIVNDETFLRSFCGTLLYCAPEVYPGYELAMRRYKRLRAADGSSIEQGARQPYTSAVDAWGLAAVLYHLLCGTAPFKGTTHKSDQGHEMLRIIMTTSVDYTRLRLGGVSEYAIDFLKRTLVIEPTQRMNDSDCLSHAWIKNKKRHEASDTAFEEASSLAALAERDPTRDTERVNDEELNAFASQLSIADQHPGRDEDLDEEIPPEEIEQMRASGQPKRKREQEDELEEEASFGDYEDDLAPCNFPFQPAPQQERMLFGEVTREALQSSGALHWQADAALEVIPPESPNQDSSESHYEGTSQFSTGDFSKAEKQQPSLTHPQTQLETSGAAPSLLGTEFMVGQLNMDSHMAGVSLPDTSSQPTGSQPTGSEPTAPKSKGTREQTPPMETEASGHESTTSSHGLYSATPPRALKPKGPTSSSHEPEGSKSQPKKREADPTESRISKRNKTSSERSEPDPTANNGTRGENIKTVAGSNQNTADQQARSSATPPQPTDTPSSSTTKASVTAQPTITASPSTNLPPPTTPLGTFTTIPGSVPYPPIHITKRATTFGRMPTNDYIWPDGFDVRVPKHAFDILFHRPHLDNALAHNPNLNWAAFEDISAIISTRTNQRIWVNGVVLERGKDCWLYGHLKTGDIITVFQPLPGGKLTGKESEKLKFRVDMRIGKSKETRNEDEPFTVLEERVQWEKEEARKSREASLRASQASSNASGGEQAAPKGKDAVAGAKDGGGDVAASAKAPASPAPKPPMPAPEK